MINFKFLCPQDLAHLPVFMKNLKPKVGLSLRKSWFALQIKEDPLSSRYELWVFCVRVIGGLWVFSVRVVSVKKRKYI